MPADERPTCPCNNCRDESRTSAFMICWVFTLANTVGLIYLAHFVTR